MRLPLSRCLILIILVMGLAGCGSKDEAGKYDESTAVSGGRSAIFSIDRVMEVTSRGVTNAVRNSALLGIHVAEYISVAPAYAASSGIVGVEALMKVQGKEAEISDPDLKLLTAFGEALSVNVAELLNRAQDRQEQLDAYIEALTNVAARANTRYRELRSSEEQLSDEIREMKRQLSSLERDVKRATNDQDYRLAGELRESVLEVQKELSTQELNHDQVSDVVRQLEGMLELFGEKVVAMEKNREALILGVKVIDVPGAEELEVIERGERRRSRSRGIDPFGSLF